MGVTLHSLFFLMNWLNPPEGYYTTEKFLEMVEHYRKSTNVNGNTFSSKPDPMKMKFLGNKKITVINDDLVRLEVI